MKAGLVQGIFALRALRDLGLEPPLAPVFFVNSDEEVGSPESVRWIRRLARRVPVFVFANNHYAGYSPDTVRDLRKRLDLPEPTRRARTSRVAAR